MRIPLEAVSSFQTEILSWYTAHLRDLPWRYLPFDTSLGMRDPYAILVSEVMSQQTQLSRVVPKYTEWMKTLPLVDDLASAEQSLVLRLWSGLGYNRRALNLQKAARVIVEQYNGVWPRDVTLLKTLPGIGDYTAAAIACFAFDQQIPVIDTNIRKVILLRFGEYVSSYCHFDPAERERNPKGVSHIVRDDTWTQLSEKRIIEQISWQLLPQGKAYTWNQALMDYAALILKKEKVALPKQSKFLGSRRSYRGKVLKSLVSYEKLTFSQLWTQAQDSHSKDEAWFLAILKELVAEGLIKQDGEYYFL